MIKITEHPAASRILENIKSLYSGGRISYSLHKHFCFICGAREDTLPDGSTSLRAAFSTYLTRNGEAHSVLPIFAEDAIDEFLGGAVGSFLDLGRFEDLIASIVDSILIFPESPGSFTELGFFAPKFDLRKKTLVATTENYQGNSFINLGPIPLYNDDSIYRPMPLVLSANLEIGFQQVVEKLTSQTNKRKYRTRFETANSFDERAPKSQLVVIYEMIRLFGYVTESNLLQVIHATFGKYDVDRVRRILAILVAMKFASRNDLGDYIVLPDPPPLFEYHTDQFDTIKAEIIGLYQKHDEDAAAFLGMRP